MSLSTVWLPKRLVTPRSEITGSGIDPGPGSRTGTSIWDVSTRTPPATGGAAPFSRRGRFGYLRQAGYSLRDGQFLLVSVSPDAAAAALEGGLPLLVPCDCLFAVVRLGATRSDTTL